jgi:L1 cell adhesion molecule like protein
MLYLEFQDAIREGDGLRVLRCWKYFLPIFRASGRKNYALEALNLIFQVTYYLPPRLRMQLLYSRFVNTQGRAGCNIPADLHMEHMNRTTKETLQHLGANKTSQAILRSSKCAHAVMTLTSNFDKGTGIKEPSGGHNTPEANQDIGRMIDVLLRTENFTDKGTRAHGSFSKIASNGLCQSLNIPKFYAWIKDHYEPRS